MTNWLVLGVCGFGVAIGGRVADGLVSLWLGGGLPRLWWVGILFAVGSVAGWVGATRWVAGRRGDLVLACGLGVFGLSLLPLPWSYRVAAWVAGFAPLQPPILAGVVDGAVALVLVTPWSVAVGVVGALARARAVARRGVPGLEGWACVWVGALAGAVAGVALLDPWPGSIRALHALAFPAFAAGFAVAVEGRRDESAEPVAAVRGSVGMPLLAGLVPLAIVVAGASVWTARAVVDPVVSQAACDSDDGRPNVVLVSLDTFRADAMGSYGSPVATPNLDAIARQGVLFEMAITPASETAPSHATLFTGQRVLRHGVRKNGLVVASGLRTLAERFEERGYATGAFVSSFVLDARFGWGQGFETFGDTFPEPLAGFAADRVGSPDAFWRDQSFEGFDRPGAWTVDEAADWIDAVEPPFFAFVHLFDAHEPHRALRHHRRRTADAEVDLEDRWLPGSSRRHIERLTRDYLADALAADEALGRLVEYVDSVAAPSCTLLVVTGDHGQGLGQHGWLGHEANLYDEQLRVPLLFRRPGRIPDGVRIAAPVGLEDVAPTIAGLAGLAPSADEDGRSLAAAVARGEAVESRPVFAYRRRYEKPLPRRRGHQNAIRTPAWKYIRSSDGPDELYDLVRDPGEERNEIGSRPGVVAELAAEMDAWLRVAPRSEATAPLPDDVQRGLEALGYVE